MAVYFITGKLGCGKTLCTVGKIRDYLRQGRRVATNLDIYLDAISNTDSKTSITRIPDKPSLADLNALGSGCVEGNEDQYGLLVLDELGTWFNSRNWRDKGRLEVINWFLHARKLHWDIYLIVQNINSLDDQLVSALCEHLVVCKRTDRLTIPLIGSLLKSIGIAKVLPKIHIAKVYYGQSESSMQVDRWWYRGKDLYQAYNTDQIFDDESCAIHTVLPAYYTNNVALIEHHTQRIGALTKLSRQVKPASNNLKYSAVAVFSLLMVLISWRTYAKFSDFHAVPVESVVQTVPAPASVVSPVVPVSLPVTVHQATQDDYIKVLTSGRPVSVSSYFVAEGRFNAILHVDKTVDLLASAFTLDDARALGYVVIMHGSTVEVRHNSYYFTFMLKSDISLL